VKDANGDPAGEVAVSDVFDVVRDVADVRSGLLEWQDRQAACRGLAHQPDTRPGVKGSPPREASGVAGATVAGSGVESAAPDAPRCPAMRIDNGTFSIATTPVEVAFP